MNNIQALIQQYCPNGVEFKELGEVCKFQRGKTITQKDTIIGDVPVIAGGQTPAYYHNEANRTGETISVSSSGAYAGFVNFWNIPVFLSDSFSVNPNRELLLTKYVFHFLKSKQDFIFSTKKGGGVPHVHGSDLAKIQIPIPPLPVQQEIANILDKFTSLEAELEAELEARRAQYEFYRNKLLTFSNLDTNRGGYNSLIYNELQVEWKTLGEIGKVCMCKRIMKNQTTTTGDIPFYKIGTFGKIADAYISNNLYQDYKNKYSYPKIGDILISASGTIGRTVIYNGEPAYFQDSNIVWIDNDESIVSNKFLFHYYKIVEWKVDGGTIARLYNDNLSKTKIPIPPMSEQERIVGILDKFDALVNDISQGLPAEIQARRSQYEYYRNLLLDFKPLSA